MILPKLLALAFALLIGASFLSAGGQQHPQAFESSPELIIFRWLPGAVVNHCSDVEERVELVCERPDWIRDAKNKHRWIAVCGGR